MDNIKPYIIIMAGCAFFLVIIIFYLFKVQPHFREFESLKREREYRDSTNLYKNGASQGYGSYYLESNDGGKNWYAIDRGKNLDQWIVKGTAEEVFPGLLDHLASWDRLTEYVKKNGPIGSDGTITEQDLKALEGTGVTVKKTGDE